MPVKPGEPGILLYRCRLCGAVESSTGVPDLFTALLYLKGDDSLPPGWGPDVVRDTDLHQCGDGRLGVSDLIGGQPHQ
jgi:hypothetical protein